MSDLTITNSFSAGDAIVASEMNTNFTDVTTWANGAPNIGVSGSTATMDGALTVTEALTASSTSQFNGTVTVGVNDTGLDVIFYGATNGAYMKWNQATDDLQLVGAAGLDIAGDIDVDGTTNLDAVDIDGTVQIDGTVTIGAYDLVVDTDCLFVDVSENAVGINTTSPIASGFTIGRQPSDANEGGQLNFEGGTSYSDPMFLDRHGNDLRLIYNGAQVGNWSSTGKITAAGGADIGGNPYQDGVWTAWTPTITGTSFVLGNGTLVAYYAQFGKTVHFSFQFIMGSTSTMGTTFTFTAPFTEDANHRGSFTTRMTQSGSGATGTANFYAGDGRIYAYIQQADGGLLNSMTNTTPWTWATGGSFVCNGTYERA
jgi:hypothetical protein